MPLLEVIGLTKVFGGLTAINNLNFQVKEGECVGLIGPNGAGKTTLVNMVSGFSQPTRGIIFFNGHKISKLKPHEIVRLGLVRTFQDNVFFGDQTVLENIMSAYYLKQRGTLLGSFFATRLAKMEEDKIRQQAVKVCEFVGLAEVKYELAENLPHGFKRLLGVAIAYATNPKSMLLDEPTAGMNADEALATVKLLKSISDQNITILIIEHNMNVIRKICTRIIVVDFGKLIAECLPEEITKNSVVVNSYLGLTYDE